MATIGTDAAQIVAEARQWIGTRWQHQAALKGVATDCLGLVAGVGLNCNLPRANEWRRDQRSLGYGRIPDARTIVAACADYLDQVAVDDIRPGDILLLRFSDGPQHFAIVSNLEPLRIVHAYAGVGRVVENGMDDNWRRRIVRAYRYRGLE